MNNLLDFSDAPDRRKKVSQRQLAANRANAKKSTGPKTLEAKAAVRFNGLKHGLTAVIVCLPGEDAEHYEALRAEYHSTLRPRNIVEHGLVDAIVVARWRECRVIRAENSLVCESFAARRAECQETYAVLSPDVETALALKALGDNSSILDHFDRYERRLTRNSAAAMRQLIEYRKNFPPSTDSITYVPYDPTSPEPQTNPIPENEHHDPIPAPDPPPLGNATAPNTVVLRPKAPDTNPQPVPEKALTAAAGAPLATRHSSLAVHDDPAAPHSSLATAV